MNLNFSNTVVFYRLHSNNHIIKFIDHKILNEIDGLSNPSSEYLAIWIWEKLKPHLPLLSTITISEEHGTGMIYKGP